jgi:SOS-response transcriptional repressor LexA
MADADMPSDGVLRRVVVDLSLLDIPTNERTFAVRYEGSGMAVAGFKYGDTVILERREANDGDVVLALNVDHVILREFEVDENQGLLRSASETHADISVGGGIRINCALLKARDK